MDHKEVYIIIGAYLLLTLAVGLIGSRKGDRSPENYFLAGRNIGTLVLFFTLVATNFSAFFFLGFAGEGYRMGYTYYALMAFGTSMAALSFYFIGYKAWLLGKAKSYISPAELIGDRTNSKTLRLVFMAVMVLFTVPYLALQPIGAGYILSALTDNEIPYFTGAVVLTGFIVLYVFIGGMRSVVFTDLKQGVLMFVLMFAAVWAISTDLGGLTAANEEVYKIHPKLFSRQGADDYFTPARWFSLMLLWMLCVPMFPQMFMRFFIAKNARSLKLSTVLYALVPAVLFIFPVIIGVLGHLSFPGLEGKEADKILPMMLLEHTNIWLSALVMVGALAAFMSTLDSQLLAISTMLTRDVYVSFLNKDASFKKQVNLGRLLVIVLAIIGLAIAYHPPETLFAIAKQTFTGYAVLFPTAVAVLNFKKVSAAGCIISILVGEFLVVGFYSGLIPSNWFLGSEPVIPVILIVTIIILAANRIGRPGRLD